MSEDDEPTSTLQRDAELTPDFAATRHDALLDFWRVYDAQYGVVQEATLALAREHPEFGPLVRGMSPEQMQQDSRVSRELLRAAIVEGAWTPYVLNARSQGALYAKLGVSFGGWYEVIGIFRHLLVPSLVEAYVASPARLAGAIAAMMSFIDHAMTLIAEQYLRTKEEDRFRLLVEAIRDYAIYMLDEGGTVVSWNAGARALKGYDEREIVGKHLSVFFTPEARERGKPAEELRIAAAEGRFEDEGWRVRKDGSRFWASVVLTAVRDPGGKLIGFAKVTRDLTERKRAENELRAIVRRLEEANAELDGFTYSVSHDLRAPLRAIDGFSRVLIEDHGPQLDDDGKRVAQIICKNTQKMGQLIDDLLNFARLGRQDLRLARLDMGKLAREAAAEVLEPSRSIDVTIGELPETDGDASLVRQVWLNLLANAVKYTRSRARATIEVTADVRDGLIVVYSVKDNGVGFDPQYQNKLFGVFQRLHAASAFEGTGVGLALVQRIVRRHGGWVNAEGKVDHGATFSFALPRKG